MVDKNLFSEVLKDVNLKTHRITLDQAEEDLKSIRRENPSRKDLI